MRSRFLAALLLAAAVVACGDGSPAGPSVSIAIEPGTVGDLMVGDQLELTILASGDAGVLSPVAWSARDVNVATVTGGRVDGLRPGTTWIVASAGPARDSVHLVVVPRPGGYSAAEVDYFLEIAFGFEYGSASEVVRKWPGDVRIQVHGQPTAEDLATLDGLIAEINALTETSDLVVVEADPLVDLHFAPMADFPDIHPGYIQGNDGFFSVWFDGTQHFTRAVILIRSDVDQTLRDHLIREEVTQSLGMANDSFLYPESIFYQAFTRVTEFAPIDEAVIEIVYREDVRAGMDRGVAGSVVRRLTRMSATGLAPMRVDRPRYGDGLAGVGSGSHAGR